MREVTYNGPANYLRINDRLLRAGVRSEVTNVEADLLAESAADVTVHQESDD